jgi:hypothetical protein
MHMTYSNDIEKSYVSPIDEFLFTFDKKHPKTASQKREIEKHQRIAKQRDQAMSDATDVLWEKF